MTPKPTHIIYFVPVDGPAVDLHDDEHAGPDTAVTPPPN